MVVRVLSVVVMPALAMLTVCCSITCAAHSTELHNGFLVSKVDADHTSTAQG
jgi:hypothetical protein